MRREREREREGERERERGRERERVGDTGEWRTTFQRKKNEGEIKKDTFPLKLPR